MGEMNETPFRVYGLKEGRPECYIECDDVSLADALLDCRKRERIVRGIQYRPVIGEPGEWLVNPWETTGDSARL